MFRNLLCIVLRTISIVESFNPRYQNFYNIKCCTIFKEQMSPSSRYNPVCTDLMMSKKNASCNSSTLQRQAEGFHSKSKTVQFNDWFPSVIRARFLKSTSMPMFEIWNLKVFETKKTPQLVSYPLPEQRSRKPDLPTGHLHRQLCKRSILHIFCTFVELWLHWRTIHRSAQRKNRRKQNLNS